MGLAFKFLARILNTNHQYGHHQPWSDRSPSNSKTRSMTHISFFFKKKRKEGIHFPHSLFFFFYSGSIFHSWFDIYTVLQTRLMKLVVAASEEGKFQHQQMAELTARWKQQTKKCIHINHTTKLVYGVRIVFPQGYPRSQTNWGWKYAPIFKRVKIINTRFGLLHIFGALWKSLIDST